MRPPAGIIRATPVIPTTSSAKGIWTLREAQLAKAQGIWPSATPIGTPTSLGSTQSTAASGTTMTHTTTAAIVAGNLVAVGIMLNTTNSVNVQSVSDGTNTYVKATNTTGITVTEIWYCANAQAVASGATLTVTYTGTAGAMTGMIAMAQVSGIQPSSPLDKTDADTSVNSTISSATGTLSQANEIVFAMTGQAASAGAYSGASGFTNIEKGENISSTGAAFDYQKVTATTSVTFTPTWGSPGSVNRNSAVVASFKGF